MSTLLPTSDLRRESKACKRDKDHSAKWARGARVAPGKTCPHDLSFYQNGPCNECAARPLLRDGLRNHSAHSFYRANRTGSNATGHRLPTVARKVLQNDLNEVSLGSDHNSSDDGGMDYNHAPLPDTDIMYSYDAQSGPSTGSDILSTALVQAVKRFENKQTEQLVKMEYDLVLDGREQEDAYAADIEDDFEVVEYEHLR